MSHQTHSNATWPDDSARLQKAKDFLNARRGAATSSSAASLSNGPNEGIVPEETWQGDEDDLKERIQYILRNVCGKYAARESEKGSRDITKSSASMKTALEKDLMRELTKVTETNLSYKGGPMEGIGQTCKPKWTFRIASKGSLKCPASIPTSVRGAGVEIRAEWSKTEGRVDPKHESYGRATWKSFAVQETASGTWEDVYDEDELNDILQQMRP